DVGLVAERGARERRDERTEPRALLGGEQRGGRDHFVRDRASEPPQMRTHWGRWFGRLRGRLRESRCGGPAHELGVAWPMSAHASVSVFIWARCSRSASIVASSASLSFGLSIICFSSARSVVLEVVSLASLALATTTRTPLSADGMSFKRRSALMCL